MVEIYFLQGDYRWIQQESTFWRRSLWQLTGACLDTSLKYAGDLELWSRFFMHERLYVSNAIFAAFRMQSKNQLSLRFLSNYQQEADYAISKMQLTKLEKQVINRYRKLCKLQQWLDHFRIISIEKYIKNYQNKNFEYPPIVFFDRYRQIFELQ